MSLDLEYLGKYNRFKQRALDEAKIDDTMPFLAQRFLWLNSSPLPRQKTSAKELLIKQIKRILDRSHALINNHTHIIDRLTLKGFWKSKNIHLLIDAELPEKMDNPEDGVIREELRRRIKAINQQYLQLYSSLSKNCNHNQKFTNRFLKQIEADFKQEEESRQFFMN